MDNLMQNKLFLQYLSGAGGAMSSGQPVGPVLDTITQQNIAAQSKAKLNEKYMKMLQQMMAGEVPTGGKVTMDEKGMKFDVPKSALDSQKLAEEGSQLPGGSGINWSDPNQVKKLSSILNPSASPLDTTGADLAGLTAADVSQALSGAVGVQGLKSDIEYKGQLMRESAARIRQMERPELPKDERTAAVKNFEYAQSTEGGSFKGTFKEWEKDAKTTHQKEFDQARAEGYKGTFHDWLRDITALGGGLSLEEKITEREAFADIKSKKYFTDPKGVAADVDKYINTEEVQNKLFALDPAKRERETIREKEKFIVSKIAASGGKIVKSKVEGRTFVWTVKWPDGKTTEVRYAN